MNYLNWLTDLYRINCKTNQQMNQTPTCDLIIDIVTEMPWQKLRKLNDLNKVMGHK